jgi:hypothetical protein
MPEFPNQTGRACEASQSDQQKLHAGEDIDFDSSAHERLSALTDSQLVLFAQKHGVPSQPFDKERIIRDSLIRGAGSPGDFSGIV